MHPYQSAYQSTTMLNHRQAIKHEFIGQTKGQLYDERQRTSCTGGSEKSQTQPGTCEGCVSQHTGHQPISKPNSLGSRRGSAASCRAKGQFEWKGHLTVLIQHRRYERRYATLSALINSTHSSARCGSRVDWTLTFLEVSVVISPAEDTRLLDGTVSRHSALMTS